MDKEKQKWLLFDEDSCIIVVPDFDSKPHATGEIDKTKKLQLAGLDCPCNPKVAYNGEKPMIIHNSFIDQERVDKAMGQN